jgi:hypothetical protein
MECGGLVHPEPSKGRRFRDGKLADQAAIKQSRRIVMLAKTKARKPIAPGPSHILLTTNNL